MVFQHKVTESQMGERNSARTFTEQLHKACQSRTSQLIMRDVTIPSTSQYRRNKICLNVVGGLKMISLVGKKVQFCWTAAEQSRRNYSYHLPMRVHHPLPSACIYRAKSAEMQVATENWATKLVKRHQSRDSSCPVEVLCAVQMQLVGVAELLNCWTVAQRAHAAHAAQLFCNVQPSSVNPTRICLFFFNIAVNTVILYDLVTCFLYQQYIQERPLHQRHSSISRGRDVASEASEVVAEEWETFVCYLLDGYLLAVYNHINKHSQVCCLASF